MTAEITYEIRSAQLTGCRHGLKAGACGRTPAVLYMGVEPDPSTAFGARVWVTPACEEHDAETGARGIIAAQVRLVIDQAPRTPEALSVRALRLAAQRLTDHDDDTPRSAQWGARIATIERAAAIADDGDDETARRALSQAADAFNELAEEHADR